MSDEGVLFIVEGRTDALIIERLYPNQPKNLIIPVNGREAVLNRLRDPKFSGGYYIIDGVHGVLDRLRGMSVLNIGLISDNVLKVKVNNAIKYLVTLGDPSNDFRGSIESLILYLIRGRVNVKGITCCSGFHDKVLLIMLVYRLMNDTEVFFNRERFVNSLFTARVNDELLINDDVKQRFRRYITGDNAHGLFKNESI
ncbi:hypothetical protein [Caldivirga sp.]|uniref:hypothetical protein n=1 Tax=Caldivirga sp. TaxID=2080243 RepID=UPI003D0C81B2